jgi:hypothetical protein
MEKTSNEELDLIFKPTENVPLVTPKVWSRSDLYQAYIHNLLKHNPECWGKTNKPAQIKNFWIYRTQKVGGKHVVVEVMSFSRWKAMFAAYFAHAKERMINEGEGLVLGTVGEIRIRRLERSFDSKPSVNHNETKKQPRVLRDGKMVPEKIIYFTDEDYLRVGWRKFNRITNEGIYEFVPTSNHAGTGLKNMVVAANKRNPQLKYIYDFYDRIDFDVRNEEKRQFKLKMQAQCFTTQSASGK